MHPTNVIYDQLLPTETTIQERAVAEFMPIIVGVCVCVGLMHRLRVQINVTKRAN